jgi:hypothetical protein
MLCGSQKNWKLLDGCVVNSRSSRCVGPMAGPTRAVLSYWWKEFD